MILYSADCPNIVPTVVVQIFSNLSVTIQEIDANKYKNKFH